jgi:hypothetical protein
MKTMIDPISTNQMFNTTGPGVPPPLPANSDPTLIAFGQIVDQIVKSSQQSYQQIQQAAIQKAEKEEELQKQISFLSGAVEEAQASLSGSQANTDPPPDKAPVENAATDLNYHQQQVVFWKEKLIQAQIPDGDTSSD